MARIVMPRGGRDVSWRVASLRLGIAAWMAFQLAPSLRSDEPAKQVQPPKSTNPPKSTSPPTFTKDVAPILQEKCQNCHRRHQVGPFALETYEQARKRATDIATVAEERPMPPWKPEPGVGPEAQARPVALAAGDRHPRGLGRGGRPAGRSQGHAAAAPVRRGLEARAARPRPRAGRGLPDPRLGPRHLPLLRDPHEPRAGHLHLGDRLPAGESAGRPPHQRVHRHDRRRRGSGTRPSRGRATPRSRGRASTPYEDWASGPPGTSPTTSPTGIGQRLPRQSDVILQVHYHPSGKPEVDRTRIGLYFSRKPVKQALHWNTASNSEFRLPAGDAERRGQGELVHPRRRRGPGRLPPHAPARAATCG